MKEECTTDFFCSICESKAHVAHKYPTKRSPQRTLLQKMVFGGRHFGFSEVGKPSDSDVGLLLIEDFCRQASDHLH